MARLACAIALVTVGGAAPAAQTDPPRPTVEAKPTAVRPLIDGRLDDEAWRGEPVETGEWLSYNPLHGDRVPQRTSVWIAYDTDNLYFAFRCDDPDASRIKTSVTRRDSIWADDWVGLSLDALGTGQLSYHMMVNPSGVQLDLLNSVASGEDEAVDWVWYSAGRLSPEGYTVEIRLPLQSIRFKGGPDTRMGLLFFRRVSRASVSVSWPALAPGTWVFERHATLAFDDLQPRPPREVTPSLTYSRRQVLLRPDDWGDGDGGPEIGIGTKVGLTPTITLDATVNPDFSQVESDAFQVEVNQRFPVFFSEKRPFFMEGAGLFALAGSGDDNSLQRAVHTRRIVAPVFGAKLTGSAGRFSFGTLSAVDEAPGQVVAPDHPDSGRDRLVNVVRAQFSPTAGNYVGMLLADTRFAGGRNSVIGTDLSWRVNDTQRVTGFALVSSSRSPRTSTTRGGAGAQFTYSYDTRSVVAVGSIEHYDPAFEMDTAFINRVGITSGSAYVERNFYPDERAVPWLRRITPFSFTQGGRDEGAGGPDFLEVVGFRFNFTRQGFLRVDRSWGYETWANERFERGRTRVWGEVQLVRWLRLDGRFTTGRAVFYDLVDPFAGRSREARGGFTWQPSGRLSQQLSFERVAFDRASTGEREYTVDIVNSTTTFQFTSHLFTRAIVQSDSSRNRVLTDLLVSYELVPGTVVYAGYGSLIERRAYVDGAWVPDRGRYLATERGLIFKASYLHRF